MSEQFGPARADGTPDAAGVPPPVNIDAARTGQIVRAVEAAVSAGISSLKDDIARVEGIGHTNFWRILMAFAAGFIILAGMSIEAYRWSMEGLAATQTAMENRLDKQSDQISTIRSDLARIEQKLDDATRPLSPLPRR